MPEWTIAKTWQGEPLSPQEIIRVRSFKEKDQLCISLEAPFHGDPPPALQPGSTDKLWQYEVVELFLVGINGDYLEIEMGPHGHYLVLKLSGVRCVEKMHIPMKYSARISGNTWQGEGRISLEHLPKNCARANAFAIHGEKGKRRFLCAFPVGGDVPDFHKPELFPPFSF
ncbi:hypothetical protein [Desulfobotulus mexicanus]|uniref:Carbohydrate-binding domain-containing protein n=1 Tax=Desulfobotulus mexicanus TaxID=2586642 RepID=A0A5Q4VDR7_9BACT|nr:hypothetical protein [Desulfobotulus mexicanus]TYT75113.1 hypothetical protein FIM25_06900 [Desulfobotulus mexicanus]